MIDRFVSFRRDVGLGYTVRFTFCGGTRITADWEPCDPLPSEKREIRTAYYRLRGEFLRACLGHGATPTRENGNEA